MRDTKFYSNPFWILGATTRDDRHRIVELAEEKSLHLDHEVCQKARSDLTNPRNRLVTEMNWLPGLSPKKVDQLLRRISEDPMVVRTESGIPTLAHANLVAAAFAILDDRNSSSEIAEFILEFAQVVEELEPQHILRDINEDRLVSRFPEIKTIDLVEAELAELKKYYRKVIIAVLDNMSPDKLLDVMTRAANEATDGGQSQATWLIDEVVDSYEVEAQVFLQKEAENISKLLNAARDCAKGGEAIVEPLIEKLDQVVQNWNKVAYPIQLSMRARGIEHLASKSMALEIRDLGVDLWNNHGMLSQSQRIILLLQERFSELPEVSETLEQDASKIEDLVDGRRQAEARTEEWAREITYQVDIGFLKPDTLRISPAGLFWKGIHYPLESITRVRWGGLIESKTITYKIGFGCEDCVGIIKLRNQEIFSTITNKLWRAVCLRLIPELLDTLRAGKTVHFGESLVYDVGITLPKHTVIGDDEHIFCNWHQVRIWSENGSFWIGLPEDKETYDALSYIDTWNVHLLEFIISMGFKKGIHKLSDLV